MFGIVRAPAIFVALTVGVAPLLGWVPAVEFVSLAFFAALGATYACIDYARNRTAALGAQLTVAPGTMGGAVSAYYEALNHPANLFFLSMLSAGALASGGGVLRRIFEILTAKVFEQIGAVFRACYQVPSVFWPSHDINWQAILYGFVFGLIVGFTVTWRVQVELGPTGVTSSIDDHEIGVNRESAMLDGFGTAFFAAFGLKAAILFFDGLPFGSWEGMPSQWHPVGTVVLLPTVLVFAALTACGGGLVRSVVIKSLLLEPGKLWSELASFPWRSTTQQAAVIGGLGMLAFLAVTTKPSGTGCIQLNEAHMLAITFASAFTGMLIWTFRHR